MGNVLTTTPPRLSKVTLLHQTFSTICYAVRKATSDREDVFVAPLFIPVVRGETGTDTSRRFFPSSSLLIAFHCRLHQPSPLPLFLALILHSPPTTNKSLFTQSSLLNLSLHLLLLPSTLSISAVFVNRSLTLFPCPAGSSPA